MEKQVFATLLGLLQFCAQTSGSQRSLPQERTGDQGPCACRAQGLQNSPGCSVVSLRPQILQGAPPSPCASATETATWKSAVTSLLWRLATTSCPHALDLVALNIFGCSVLLETLNLSPSTLDAALFRGSFVSHYSFPVVSPAPLLSVTSK